MVQLMGLEALRAEHAALEIENATLRSRVLSAQLAGDESAVKVEETLQTTARLAILTREQKVLVAGLRLGEELVALRKSNEVLFRRGQQLQEDNASLSIRLDATLLPTQAAKQQNTLSPPGFVQAQQNAPAPLDVGSSPVPKKCSPEEKAERRELVASLLKAGLNQDVQTICLMRGSAVQTPVIPKIQGLTPDSYGRSRSTDRARDSGARNRESSHSGAVEESKYLRELAIRDMLLGISRVTPRR